MSVDALSYKLSYLHDQVAQPLRALLHESFCNTKQQIKDQTSFPEAVWSTLEIETLYCLFRHRSWIGTGIVNDLLVEYLATSYRLPQELGQQIVDNCVITLSALLPRGIAPIADQEFLQYVFVETASAANEANLIVDLGIGSRLIQTLKSAAKTVFDKDQSPCFLGQFDTEVSEIMLSVAQEINRNPWALDIHRMRFHLKAYGINHYQGTSLNTCFDGLAYIGCKRTIHTQSLEKWLMGHDLTLEYSQKIIEDLLHSELIYKSEHRAATKKKESIDKYSLTERGYQLTSTCFIRRYFHRVRDPLKKLLSLPGSYQKAAILQLNDPSLMTSILRDHTISLTPEGLSAALRQIAESGDIPSCVEIIKNTVSTSSNPWLRKSSVESLTYLSNLAAKELDDIIGIVTKDRSPAVRNATTSTLIQLNKPEHATDLILQSTAL